MPTTAFADINAAFCAELAAGPALAGGRIYPQELGPIPEEADSALVVRQGRARTGALVVSGGPRDWATVYIVECHARDVPGAVPGTAADALMQAAFQRLATRTDWGLGVAAVLLEPELQWDFSRAETDMACINLAVQVQHRTLADLSAPT